MSFKGVCTYVLSDADKKKTADRVLWTGTLNLETSANEAWREMYATWRDRTKLKREAGVDLRGRDNTKPVLHMTLAWHPDDAPTPEHMKEASLSALKAIGLEGHQVLLAAHDDKKHLHMHLIINTVDPKTGRTAPMKYTKERLSRWAEAYEKEHGLRIEQRVENNERRDKLKSQRKENAAEILLSAEKGITPPDAMPYVPVKGQSPSRADWQEQQKLVAEMEAMRRDHHLQSARHDQSTLSERHAQEHSNAWQNMRSAIEGTRASASTEYRPRWRKLFERQRKEIAYLENAAVNQTVRRGSINTTKRYRGRNVVERAIFVYRNRNRLGYRLPLSATEMTELIASPDKLMKRVLDRQDEDRRFLGRLQRRRANELGQDVKKQHAAKIGRLAAQHRAEREELTRMQAELRSAETGPELHSGLSPGPELPRPFKRKAPNERLSESFKRQAENPAPSAANTFNDVSNTQKLSRAEQIRRDMEKWRKRNRDRDQGREL